MSNSALPRTLRLAALSVVSLLSSALLAVAASVKFDIPAQPATSALQLFSKQSGAKVLFPAAEIKAMQSGEVKGEMEPAAALERLLSGTGYNARQTGPSSFVVAAPEVEKPGSIEGYVRSAESGRGVAGARVEIAGTDKFVLTDKRGRFTFDEAPTGDQELHITAEGMQNTKVTDVTVKPGHRHTLSSINIPAKSADVMQLDPYVVSAKKNDGVVELDPYSVEGRREKPFQGANVDIPRTVNDTQPYYILDSKAIEASGAANLENFLKERLTMNAMDVTSSQIGGYNTGTHRGNTSEINLRGLGADKTLILVNGRRMAGVTLRSVDYQPDLNGIPMSAIDRIEVLPSSASGIYGGSAIGGVVNVILKKDYTGGEIRATYRNAWDTDIAKRDMSVSYGLALEGGRTHVTLNAAWSDANTGLLQDRRGLLEESIAILTQNSPSFLFASSTPWVGALPNIRAVGNDMLILKDGRSLNSNVTHIASGTSPSSPTTELFNSLLANAGSWNLELPPTTQNPTGLLRPLAVTPKTQSFRASIRRQFLPKLEVFADFFHAENRSTAIFNHSNLFVSYPVLSTAPTSPFTGHVFVNFPYAADIPQTTDSVSQSATLGAIAQLPLNWTGEIDYTWSQNRFSSLYYFLDAAVRNDFLNGAINPFVDTLRYPVPLDKYLYPNTDSGSNMQREIALRGAGPLPFLPWGQSSLAFGLGRRTQHTPERTFVSDRPIDPLNSARITFFAREAVTDSAYAETSVPLVKQDWLPFVHALDLQMAGRIERFTVDSGTPSKTEQYNRNPPTTTYASPTLNGQPYFAQSNYTARNYTVGLRFQPLKDVTLRASRATAFLPPTPAQLVTNPQPNSSLTNITDPTSGARYGVQIIAGGNPNLKPQHSSSLNAGVIWEPKWRPLEGLRLNAEYYRIEQFDAIGSLSAQLILNDESVFSDRVERDSNGRVTLIDTSFLNLYHRETEGWDMTADYTVRTRVGLFNLRASESIILSLKNQYSRSLPEYDSVNFPTEGGAVKYKSNAALTWEWQGWMLNWSARYFGSHKIDGATGGPRSQQANGGVAPGNTTFITAQGSDTIPSQIYHDLFIGYAFGKVSTDSSSRLRALGSSLSNGLTLQLGVGNVFAKVPPLDASRSVSTYYRSPYGGFDLRTYWVTVKKAF